MADTRLAIRNLAPLANAITRMAYTRPPNQIASVDETHWPDPLQPVTPIGPLNSEPLDINMMYGQNLTYTPRADALYKASELQKLATYPLARLCIENAKDTIVQMPRQVRVKPQPGESKKEALKRGLRDENLAKLNRLFDWPSHDWQWDDWIRRELEDMYVGDYASTILRRQGNGPVQEMGWVPGEYITRYIDECGGTPFPPSPAYAQLWEGIPRVNLTTLQLVYKMRNVVPRAGSYASYLYGMSPTEEMADEIQIGANWLAFVLAFYTRGNMPEMIHVIPPNVTKDKVKESLDAINASFAGNLAKRRGIMPLQGFVEREGQSGSSSGDQIIFPKEKALGDLTFYERHIHLIAYGYMVSPTRLLKQLNRSTAGQNQEATEEENTGAIVKWVKNLCDDIIQRRAPLGVKVDTSGYEMDIEPSKETDPVKQAQVDKTYVDMGQYTRNELRERNGDDPRPEPEADMLTVTTAMGAVPLNIDKQIDQQKKKQEAMPEDANANGKPNSPRGSKIAKRREARIDTRNLSAASLGAKTKIERAVARVFRRQKDKAADEARGLLRKYLKSEDSDRAQKIADAIFKAIEAGFASLPAETRSALEEAAKSGVNDAILQVELTDSDMISEFNSLAADYASKRAAEMVGMKYDDEGNLVTNPNAKYAISDTTRDELRTLIKNAFEESTPLENLISDIRDAGMFSESRAALIGRTEVMAAQVRSNFDVWKSSGLVRKVKWIVDGNPCPECLLNADVVRPIGEAFPSGALHPLQHPRCECILQALDIRPAEE